MIRPTHQDPTLVVCPKCRGRAVVVPVQQEETAVRVVCPGCGFSKSAEGKRQLFQWYKEQPGDGYFGLDLWLQTRCKNHILWAFNRRHMDFLETYVGSTLRQRSQDDRWGWQNRALASRLPKWITAADNRSAVLKALKILREKYNHDIQ